MAAVTLRQAALGQPGSLPIVGSLARAGDRRGSRAELNPTAAENQGCRDRRSPPVEERELPIPGVRFVSERRQVSCPRSHEGPSIRRAFRVPDVDVGNPAGLRRPAVRMIRRLTPPDCRLGSRPKVIVGFELSGLPRAVCGLSRKRLAGPVFIIVSVRSWRPSALSRPRSPEPSSRRRRWSHVPCSGLPLRGPSVQPVSELR